MCAHCLGVLPFPVFWYILCMMNKDNFQYLSRKQEARVAQQLIMRGTGVVENIF